MLSEKLRPAQLTKEAALRDLAAESAAARVAAAEHFALLPSDEAPVIEALKSCISDHEADVRAAAYRALSASAQHGASWAALETLLDALDEERDTKAKQTVVLAIGQCLSEDSTANEVEQVVGALTPLLADADADLRFQAVNVLGEKAAQHCANALIESLADPDAEVRGSAAAALGDIPFPPATAGLLALLSDPCPSTRLEAAMALVRRGDPRGIKETASFLADNQLCGAAAHTLYRAEPNPTLLAALLAHQDEAHPLAQPWVGAALVRCGARDSGERLLRNATRWRRQPEVRALARQLLRELAEHADAAIAS
ncbi:MAG: HEAT repeat domain-containing protein [Deltaproteobacteria bacterium]|nr:HEAT repeat domain-containing protein [Deltaproteobacteria bacterium]